MNPRYLPTTTDGKLDRLSEEMGEVLQALGKCRRFGHATRWCQKAQARVPSARSNDEMLLAELGDLIDAAARAERAVERRVAGLVEEHSP